MDLPLAMTLAEFQRQLGYLVAARVYLREQGRPDEAAAVGAAIERLARQFPHHATPPDVAPTEEPPMNAPAAIPLSAELTAPQALALAQLVKRLTWGEIRACAVDDAEAHVMVDALGKLAQALADQGFAPR